VILGELAKNSINKIKIDLPKDGKVSHVHVEDLVGGEGLIGSGFEEASSSERGQHLL
jgi:hypothetical protein